MFRIKRMPNYPPPSCKEFQQKTQTNFITSNRLPSPPKITLQHYQCILISENINVFWSTDSNWRSRGNGEMCTAVKLNMSPCTSVCVCMWQKHLKDSLFVCQLLWRIFVVVVAVWICCCCFIKKLNRKKNSKILWCFLKPVYKRYKQSQIYFGSIYLSVGRKREFNKREKRESKMFENIENIWE